MLRYFMPTEVFFGENSLEKHFEKLDRLGKRAFLVTGKSSAIKSGVLDDLIPLLKKHKIDYEIFSEIMENPELKTIHIAKEIVQKFNPDFIIGIGGGSPIDAAKAISVCAANNFVTDEFYSSKNIKTAIPIVAIPTTSGTGTEVTPYSVVTNTETMKKAGFGNPLIFPKISILDPKYTVSLPEKNTRDTAIDALSHLLEGIYSNKRNVITYPMIFEGIKLIIENLEISLKKPHDINSRRNLMLGSMYGGIVIAQSSTTLQHSIGYPVTTELGITHGNANGMVMEYIMELFYNDVKNDIDNLFEFLQITKQDF
ncbi:MAG: iron-containing alcohol dehydrogenase, partial [Candidatus Cloacimonadota bacterium]|nr:iron-containing alcohol dehydrogenase [Candidatus Cloacimonadota bacterium]